MGKQKSVQEASASIQSLKSEELRFWNNEYKIIQESIFPGKELL